MKKWNVFRVVAAVALVMSFASGVSASAGDIKARMKSRLPEIIALKANGIIGENNIGYLEFIETDNSKKKIVDDENSDRKKVYNAIAKQQGVKVEIVGSRRAKKIAEKAKPGEWLQDNKGKWYRK